LTDQVQRQRGSRFGSRGQKFEWQAGGPLQFLAALRQSFTLIPEEQTKLANETLKSKEVSMEN
jgi:hypothetical protein